MAQETVRYDLLHTPPVIVDPDQPDGLHQITFYRDQYFGINIPQLAATLGKVLAPYFHAYNSTLHDAGAAPSYKPSGRIKSLIHYLNPLSYKDAQEADYSKPGALTAAFEYHAEVTHNIVLPHYVVAPINLYTEKIQGLHEIKPFPSGDYIEGFMQSVHSKSAGDMENRYIVSSVSFGFFGLDDKNMKALVPHQPQKMYEALQDILQYCGHDIQHHFTNLMSADSIAQRNRPESYVHKMLDYSDHNMPNHYAHPLNYESVLILSHAETMRRMRQGEGEQRAVWDKLEQAVDTYLDELERIAAELEMNPALSTDKKHCIIDYFSTAVPYNLVKVVPLNDPLMLRVWERMEKMDPSPASVRDDFTRKDGGSLEATLKRLTTAPLPDPKHFPDGSVPSKALTIEHYEQAGHRLVPEKAEEGLSYSAVKQLQMIDGLAEITFDLAPAPAGSLLAESKAKVGSINRGVFNIIKADMLRP